MKRKVKAALLSVLLVMALLFAAAASGGTSSDPLVSKSYVDGRFFDGVISGATARIDSAVKSFTNKYVTRASEAANFDVNGDAYISAVADAVIDSLQSEGEFLFSTSSASAKKFKAGDVISGRQGMIFIVKSGYVRCTSGKIIDITKGTEASAPCGIGNNTGYMFPENGGSIEIITKDAEILIDGVYSVSAYKPKYTDEAYAMKKLGLVRGAANGMELYRGNTRAESITMLIRLLGEEENALMAEHQHPFTDVDAWAERYVGYAYRSGYTKGVSATRYDGSSMTTSIQYMTFILRALGYSEEAGDFKYASAVDDAVRLGVISQSEAAEIYSSEFRRDQVMHLSYLALHAKVKGSSRTLLSKLVANGAVDGNAANEFLRR
ncbi:MAG: hypothetical protein IIV97_04645 [Oscillospiraceae bacterium]|nr:hypothetical protein [Oscillospiraceae bacterium]